MRLFFCNYIFFFTNNINMISFIIFLCVGILNGIFASGAGQLLTFYLIFILKKETHISRIISITILSFASFFSIFGYLKFFKFSFFKILFLIIIALLGAIIGSKIMKKLNGNILNLLSGILIIVLTLYRLFMK